MRLPRRMTVAVRPRASSGWTALAAGTAYVTLGAVARKVPRQERRVFRAVNATGGSIPPLRLPQQMGTPWMLPTMALAGFVTSRPHLALSAAFALPLEKGLEVGVKKAIRRKRPAKLIADVELHDDAPTDGPSYPSGHAAIATAVVLLAAPYVSPVVTAAMALSATATTLTRVHQGAHFPVDGVGGALLGVTVAAGLNAVVGVPVRRTLLGVPLP